MGRQRRLPRLGLRGPSLVKRLPRLGKRLPRLGRDEDEEEEEWDSTVWNRTLGVGQYGDGEYAQRRQEVAASRQTSVEEITAPRSEEHWVLHQ